MPPLAIDILNLFAALIRLLGMILIGFSVARLTLEMFRKGIQAWQLQAALFLGLIGLIIGLAAFIGVGALGGFGIGAGTGLLMGLRTKKEEQKKEDKLLQ